MAKLIETNSASRMGIGEDALLHFIDEINCVRARSSSRFRMRPVRKADGVLGMEDYYEIRRPMRPDTPSERYGR
jgi:hypothetical protein